MQQHKQQLAAQEAHWRSKVEEAMVDTTSQPALNSLKQENERLRQEVSSLRAQIGQLELQVGAKGGDHARGRLGRQEPRRAMLANMATRQEHR